MKASVRSVLSQKNQQGISMIEVLIVVALLAVLFIIVLSQLGPQNLRRARDAERKDDLRRIKIAFEEYYSDNSCYPPPDILLDCGSSDLSPYIGQVPCDPLTQEPYVYAPHPNTENHCRGYRVYAPMEWSGDPVIEDLGCEGEDGCGVSSELVSYSGVTRWRAEDYRYGVSEGVPLGLTEGGSIITSGFCCRGGADRCEGFDLDHGVCNGSSYATLDACIAANNGCDD